MNFYNRVNFRQHGWVLDGEAEITYRSHYHGWTCGERLANSWLSCEAHNAAGDTATIWWHIPRSVMDKLYAGVEVDGCDLVHDWDKCHEILAGPTS